MDSRDIKEVPPVLEDFSYLENIFGLQKELLDHYIKIEGLPPYDGFNINIKKNQNILKDFTGRIIEELGESYESLVEIQSLSKKNKYWYGDFPDQDFKMVINHLQNATEEVGDALHFMMELLIYSDIDVNDIKHNILNKYVQEYPALRVILEKGNPHINMGGVLGLSMACGAIILTNENESADSFEGVHTKDLMKCAPGMVKGLNLDFYLYACGRYYHPESYQLYKNMLWDVTYYLSLARNCLKNKPWKQSQMMTDEKKYQGLVIKAFLVCMGTFYYMGFDPYTLFYVYFKKNKINQFRIKSKY